MIRNLKVLCIDDSSTIRAFVGASLKNAPVDLFWAEDGLEGLAMAWSTRPDIIFVDLLMPKLSGSRLCEILKALPETRQIPIHVLTSKSGPVNLELLALSGADGYLHKPLTQEGLLQAIGTVRDSL